MNKKWIFLLFTIFFVFSVCQLVMADQTISVGQSLTFGHYEQDNNLSNGAEPIEWIVLDIQDDYALLLSKYLLDAKPYDEGNRMDETLTWETSTIRSWLNNEFLNYSFTNSEQNLIWTMILDNSCSEIGDSDYNYTWQESWDKFLGKTILNCGNNTEDKVFLLSLAQARKYFGNKFRIDAGRTAPTYYAKSHGAASIADDWWLRSLSIFAYDDTIRHYPDVIRPRGFNSKEFESDKIQGIRPAICIKLQ